MTSNRLKTLSILLKNKTSPRAVKGQAKPSRQPIYIYIRSNDTSIRKDNIILPIKSTFVGIALFEAIANVTNRITCVVAVLDER